MQTELSGNQAFSAQYSKHLYLCMLANMNCQHQPARHVQRIEKGKCKDDCRKRTQFRSPESCASDFVGFGGLVRSLVTNNYIRMAVVAPNSETEVQGNRYIPSSQ